MTLANLVGMVGHSIGNRAVAVGLGDERQQDEEREVQRREDARQQHVDAVGGLEAVGEYAAPYQPGMLFHDTNETPVGPDHAPPAAPRYFNMRKTTIYGGSTEVQKNIVSKAILGL